jgi:hypothetical protein
MVQCGCDAMQSERKVLIFAEEHVTFIFLKKESVYSSETLVPIYQTILGHSEVHNLITHQHKDFISHVIIIIIIIIIIIMGSD